jgi:glucose-1-phosphate adenylyltransferase
MELLEEPPALDLYERSWVIRTRSEERPPALVSADAKVHNSLISHGCVIQGEIEHSVLSPGVRVEKGAVVRDSIILFDTVIGAGTVLDRVIVDKEVVIGTNCKIGLGEDNIVNKQYPQRLNTGITIIGKHAVIPDNVTIGRNCLIAGEVGLEDFTTTEIASGESVMANSERLLRNFSYV